MGIRMAGRQRSVTNPRSLANLLSLRGKFAIKCRPPLSPLMPNRQQSPFASLRVVSALLLCSAGGLLAMFGVGGVPPFFLTTQSNHQADDSRPRYMPVRGDKGEDLSAMEQEWNDRLTYPTGRF